MGGGKKGCKWWLGVIVNKIETSNPEISLLNYIDTPPNPNSNNILEIADSGANIHVAKQATPTMASVIMDNGMKARLPNGIIMESTNIATLQVLGLIKQVRQIHIFPKMQTAPLILWWVLYDDGCTITPNK